MVLWYSVHLRRFLPIFPENILLRGAQLRNTEYVYGESCTSDVYGKSCTSDVYGESCTSDVCGESCTSDVCGKSCTLDVCCVW